MAENSKIQWTHHTWNPWRGCTMISPGCANCYMFAEQTRYGRDPKQVIRTKTWGNPRRWQGEAKEAGRRDLVFTCSWSDWFHEDADAWRDEAWKLIRECPNLHFQVLTKRHERIASHLPADWGMGYANVWLGVSVENRRHGLPRIDALRVVPAAIRFLSIEPLLEDLGHIDLAGIHWVIVGGESGKAARPFNLHWARSIVHQCRVAGVACFVKQLGAVIHARNIIDPLDQFPGSPRTMAQGPDEHTAVLGLIDRKGGDPDEWPEDLRVREFPHIAAAV